VYWLLTENYVLNTNILVFMLIHTELFSNVSGLGPGLEKIAQLASLTSLHHSHYRCCYIRSRLLYASQNTLNYCLIVHDYAT